MNTHTTNEQGTKSGTSGMARMAEMMKQMPPGMTSPSGHYWCSMCKKMFELDEPVCPYMPKMCVNTPIAIETVPPGSTAFYERAGLFYPKFIQRVLATAVATATDEEPIGVAFAEDFIDDLTEWNVQYESSPIETVKSFLIYTAGFDVVTRSTDAGLTFLLMDAEAFWGEDMPAKKKSKTALLAGARRVAQAIGFDIPIDLHFMTVMPGAMGRYFCGGCNMFFEFGQPQAQVTCPFMPQKCIFRPKPVSEVTRFNVEMLTKIFTVSPKLYRRQLESALERGLDPAMARKILSDDMKSWGFDISDAEALSILWQQLGIGTAP